MSAIQLGNDAGGFALHLSDDVLDKAMEALEGFESGLLTKWPTIQDKESWLRFEANFRFSPSVRIGFQEMVFSVAYLANRHLNIESGEGVYTYTLDQELGLNGNLVLVWISDFIEGIEPQISVTAILFASEGFEVQKAFVELGGDASPRTFRGSKLRFDVSLGVPKREVGFPFRFLCDDFACGGSGMVQRISEVSNDTVSGLAIIFSRLFGNDRVEALPEQLLIQHSIFGLDLVTIAVDKSIFDVAEFGNIAFRPAA